MRKAYGEMMLFLEHDFASSCVIGTVRLINGELLLLIVGKHMSVVQDRNNNIKTMGRPDSASSVKVTRERCTHTFGERESPQSLVPRKFPNTLQFNQELSLKV